MQFSEAYQGYSVAEYHVRFIETKQASSREHYSGIKWTPAKDNVSFVDRSCDIQCTSVSQTVHKWSGSQFLGAVTSM